MASPDPAKPRRSNAPLFIALGIVALLMGVFFFMDYAIQRSGTMHFQYEGREAQGKIESLAWSGTNTLYPSYEYSDEFGAVHHGTDAYPLAGAKDLVVGQPLDIIYLGTNTDKSRIGAHQSMMMSTLKNVPWDRIGYMAAGGLLCIAIGIFMRNRGL